MTPIRLDHTFVAEIPEHLRPGICYISLRYATAAHFCPCGCRSETITPLSPTDWTLTFNGETVSLHPSISNRICPRRSHYWIKQNRIHWATEHPSRPSRDIRRRVDRVIRLLRRLILRLARRLTPGSTWHSSACATRGRFNMGIECADGR